jgi:hypothetical protein
MARVKVKANDTRYSHLKKMYTDKPTEEVKIQKVVEKVEIVQERIAINRNKLALDIAVLFALAILGASGYIFFKII